MIIRDMMVNEAEVVSDLVLNVFFTFIAPSYSDEGKSTFTAFAQPQKVAWRHRSGHFTLVAESKGRVVGVVQVRKPSHILMLFVDGQMHRRGIGRELVESALKRMSERKQ